MLEENREVIMGGKPEFWDFFRAMRISKKDDCYLEVRSKETREVTVYYKTDRMRSNPLSAISFLSSLMIGIIILFNSIRDSWPNLQIDLNLINFSIAYLVSILVFRSIYERAEFEEAPEEEWNDSGQSRGKTRSISRLLWKSVSLILIMAAFLFSYSYTYFRYLIEDGANKASAEISFHTSDDTEIVLDMSTPEGAVFDRRLSRQIDIMMKVTLKKIPDEAELYANGKRIDMDYMDRKFHFFWGDEYFESSTNVFMDLYGQGEVNTLEIKAGSFDKVWTFILKGE